jgi:CDP-diacylglycerol--glycerol-3-phosphate 3-phosphatidyltransferase
MAMLSTSRPPVFNLPNQLTAARLLLAIVLFALIAAESWLWCLVVFALAAFTDWLDGYLARRQGLTSALGRLFDPLVDKVLICGAFIFLLADREKSGLAPWMVTVVVGRELVITGLRSFLENKDVTFGADWLGKVKMVLQCVVLLVVFLTLHYLGSVVLPDGAPNLLLLRDCLIYAMLAATALSGLQYLWRAYAIFRTSRLN